MSSLIALLGALANEQEKLHGCYCEGVTHMLQTPPEVTYFFSSCNWTYHLFKRTFAS